MRRKFSKKLVSAVLCATLSIGMFTGCSSDSGKETSGDTADGVMTIDVFDNQANFQGTQSGWFGKIVADKFGLELNIISPIISGGGDSLYQTRSAAGNLGDLIITDGGNVQDLVDAGLVMDISKYLDGKENLAKYQTAIDASNAECVTDGGTYLIPSEVTEQSGTTPCESGGELNTGVYLRWDLYKELGYPEMNTMEDMLDVLKDMQDMCTESDSGKKVYAFSFFKDWDGSLMEAARQGFSYYGYGMENFCLYKADGSDYISAIDENSPYVRTLKMFYEANQLGLIDPESTTQNYDTLYSKYQDGQVLYAPWAWLGKSAYNTTEHKEAGKAMAFVPVKDEQIYSYGCYPEGNTSTVMLIGSQAKDPQKIVDFIDWLYSPEGIATTTTGPEGMTWEIKDGKPVMTEFGEEALLGDPKNAMVSEEWGTGSYYDGQNWLNYKMVAPTEKNPNTGYTYDKTEWDCVKELSNTEIEKDWKNFIGYDTTKEYLIDTNQALVAPGITMINPQEDSAISTIRNQCKSIVVEKSWQMVYAKDEAEFNSLLKEMQEAVNGLGYEDVYQSDLATAQMKQAERAKLAQ